MFENLIKRGGTKMSETVLDIFLKVKNGEISKEFAGISIESMLIPLIARDVELVSQGDITPREATEDILMSLN